MKEKLVWQERFNIGVDFLDKEHRKLFSTMSRLLDLCENETKSEWACKEGIKYLRNHTKQHFQDEEEYMQSIHYSEYEIHKRLHDAFAQHTLPSLEKELKASDYSMKSIRHFLGVCIGWMTGHTLIEDHAITGKTESKWLNLPPEEELSAMEQTIIHLIKDMFQLDAQVVSEHYSGQDFGKGICCRLLYHSEQGENWEIILAFEEQVLIETVSEMLSIRLSKVDDLVINATRYIARQFLERIRERFPVIDLYQLDHECLLTYEQLLQVFEKEHPRFSLLFDADIGYFAFCANSAEMTQDQIGYTITHQNAMREIEKYLHKNDNIPKKKILVVDDSDTVRNSIEKLLEDDYSITLASSGVAAIKGIALDKPDLILLDYEMPVCDGKQTLEMIRHENDMADIPVIFLTGKSDKESVSKVMSLKPSGYLLKKLPPEEIKKNIDSFFRKQSRAATPLT